MPEENILHLYLSSTYLEAFRASEPGAKLISREDAEAGLLRNWHTYTHHELINFFRSPAMVKVRPTQVRLIFPDRTGLPGDLSTEIQRAIREFVDTVEVVYLHNRLLKLPAFEGISHSSFLLLHTWGVDMVFHYVKRGIKGWEIYSSYQAPLIGTPLECLREEAISQLRKKPGLLTFPQLEEQDPNFISDLQNILKAPAADIRESMSIKGKNSNGEAGFNDFRFNTRLTDQEFPDIFFGKPEYSTVIRRVFKLHQGSWPPTYILGDDFFRSELVREAFVRLIKQEQTAGASSMSIQDIQLLEASSKAALDRYRATLLQSNQEKQAWEKACAANDRATYQAFLDQFPQSSRRGEAQQKIAALEEAQAQARKRAQQREQEQIKKRQQEETQRQEARIRQAWQEAEDQHTIEAYARFKQAYPQHPLAREAAQRIAALEAEALPSTRFEPEPASSIPKPGSKPGGFSRFKRVGMAAILLVFIGGGVLLAFQYLPIGKQKSSPTDTQGLSGTYQGEYQGRIRRLEVKATNTPNQYLYSLIPEGNRHRDQTLRVNQPQGKVRLESLGEGKIYLKNGKTYLESTQEPDWKFSK